MLGQEARMGKLPCGYLRKELSGQEVGLVCLRNREQASVFGVRDKAGSDRVRMIGRTCVMGTLWVQVERPDVILMANSGRWTAVCGEDPRARDWAKLEESSRLLIAGPALFLGLRTPSSQRRRALPSLPRVPQSQ